MRGCIEGAVDVTAALASSNWCRRSVRSGHSLRGLLASDLAPRHKLVHTTLDGALIGARRLRGSRCWLWRTPWCTRILRRWSGDPLLVHSLSSLAERAGNLSLLEPLIDAGLVELMAAGELLHRGHQVAAFIIVVLADGAGLLVSASWSPFEDLRDGSVHGRRIHYHRRLHTMQLRN